MYHGWDELQNALKGIPLVQNSEDESDIGEGKLNEYMVLQPNFWSSADASTDLVFEEGLLVSDEAVDIEGEFSFDLDLFYTSEDVIRLFDYFYKDYLTICELALEKFKTDKDD